MSAYLIGLGFKADMGTPIRKLILLKLIDHCHEDGTHIFPAHSTIAAAAQCSTRQVKRELAAFCECGLLRIVREGGKGPGSTNEYALDVERLIALSRTGWEGLPAAGSEAGSQDCRNDAELPAKKGDTVSPLSPVAQDKGDTGDTKRVTPATAKGDSWSPTNPHEPSREPSTSAREARLAGGGGGFEKPGEGLLGIPDGPNKKRLLDAWHHWDGRFNGSEANLLAEAAKLTPDEFERAVDTSRIDAFRALERRDGGPKLKLFVAYVRDRKFDAEPVSAELARAKNPPQRLEPYGKGWMAHRLWLLAHGPKREWKPTPVQQALINEGKGDIVAPDRRRAEHWLVTRLDSDAENGRAPLLRDGEGLEGNPETFVPIARYAPQEAGSAAGATGNSKEWSEWENWHTARDWPWITPPAHVRFVWVPSGFPVSLGSSADASPSLRPDRPAASSAALTDSPVQGSEERPFRRPGEASRGAEGGTPDRATSEAGTSGQERQTQ